MNYWNKQIQTGLDAFACASRPVCKFVKEFSSKHQGVFQKLLHQLGYSIILHFIKASAHTAASFNALSCGMP